MSMPVDLLESVFDALAEGVVVQDAQGTPVRFNRASLDILGLTAEEFLRPGSLDTKLKLFAEDMQPMARSAMPSYIALATGARATKVFGFENSNGMLRWISVTATPLFAAGHTIADQVMITFVDISASREAQKRVESSEAFLRAITDNIPAMLAYWTPDLICAFANKMSLEVFRKTREEMIGINMFDFLGPELYKESEPLVRKALAGKPQQLEGPLTRTDGSKGVRWVQYVPDERDGIIHGVFALVSDITALKTAEAMVVQERANLAAAAKLSALGEMAGGVAHEINNPVAIIYGKADQLSRMVAKRDYNHERLADGLAVIAKTSSRIAKIVRGLRSFSRNAGNDPMVPSPVETIVDDTFELCLEKFRNQGIDLRRAINGPLTLECRAVEISQVLMNLLINGFDAVSDLPEKWVQVGATLKGGGIEFSVTDSGRGISPAIVDKIMNPFFTTKEVGKGTGLGLSIGSGIIASHGGRLTYDANSVNTRFVFTLPLTQPR